ncbi:MAG: hypothetical protein KA536_11450 [Saprospiraceae bacterium]|nr:hypothetical protein [Saprospiraceae bacterium]
MAPQIITNIISLLKNFQHGTSFLIFLKSPGMKATMKIYFNENDQLIFDGLDSSPVIEENLGDFEYEVSYIIHPDGMQKLYNVLGLFKNDKSGLLNEVNNRFGDDINVFSLFKDFLIEHGIKYYYWAEFVYSSLKLITNSDRQGSGYFEFIPVKFPGNHFYDRSVFIEERWFCLVYHPFEKHMTYFHWCDAMELPVEKIDIIVYELETLAKNVFGSRYLADVPEYNAVNLESHFEHDWLMIKDKIFHMVTDLADWLKKQKNEVDFILLCGV